MKLAPVFSEFSSENGDQQVHARLAFAEFSLSNLFFRKIITIERNAAIKRETSSLMPSKKAALNPTIDQKNGMRRIIKGILVVHNNKKIGRASCRERV